MRLSEILKQIKFSQYQTQKNYTMPNLTDAEKQIFDIIEMNLKTALDSIDKANLNISKLDGRKYGFNNMLIIENLLEAKRGVKRELNTYFDRLAQKKLM